MDNVSCIIVIHSHSHHISFLLSICSFSSGFIINDVQLPFNQVSYMFYQVTVKLNLSLLAFNFCVM